MPHANEGISTLAWLAQPSRGVGQHITVMPVNGYVARHFDYHLKEAADSRIFLHCYDAKLNQSNKYQQVKHLVFVLLHFISKA